MKPQDPISASICVLKLQRQTFTEFYWGYPLVNIQKAMENAYKKLWKMTIDS
jgi:hypothetical protein